jgi:hypothetical protein
MGPGWAEVLGSPETLSVNLFRSEESEFRDGIEAEGSVEAFGHRGGMEHGHPVPS